MADMAEFWTTEQVADHLGIEPQDVYETRRRGVFPGIVGTRRGRRLMFRSDLIEAGPTEPETTSDPLVALLWTAQGIESKLAEILKELRKSVQAAPNVDPPTCEHGLLQAHETGRDKTLCPGPPTEGANVERRGHL